jgi:hypothetical protein
MTKDIIHIKGKRTSITLEDLWQAHNEHEAARMVTWLKEQHIEAEAISLGKAGKLTNTP